MSAVVTMKQLLEAGVHFGHQTRRWNPKMKRFIYGERAGIYIIDLQQTLARIEQAYTYVRDTVADGGTLLFIGTKKQTQEPIARAATSCGMPYINERWLGGMLTNFTTIHSRVEKMHEYERMLAAGDFDAMPKKEALILSRELEKLQRNLGGITDMKRQPDAVFIIDTKKEHIAVTEANKLKIPIVAVVDTNCDPDVIDYVIPGNDDAIRSANLMCRVMAEAVKEGRFIASKRGGAAAPPPATRSPEEQAAWEQRQAEARAQAAAQAAEREARLAGGGAGGQQSATTQERVAQAEAPAPPSTPETGAHGADPGEATGSGVDAARSAPGVEADTAEPEQGAVPAPEEPRVEVPTPDTHADTATSGDAPTDTPPTDTEQ